MVYFPADVEWVKKFIPDLLLRVEQFTVDTDELDDELIEIFSGEIVRLTGELEQGLSAGDHELIRISAHSIKGMGGAMGLPEISVIAQEIECSGKENRMDRCQELSGALISWAKVFEPED